MHAQVYLYNDDDDDTELKIAVAINKGIILRKMKSFVYWGTTITEKRDEEKEIEARIMKGMKYVKSLRPIMCAKKESRNCECTEQLLGHRRCMDVRLVYEKNERRKI